jgi:hypothetical protein
LRRALLLSALLLSAPALAETPKVRKVPVHPPTMAPAERGGLAGLFGGKSRRACVPVDRIAGAVVTSERSIELVLTGGERWRMGFREDCPALSYYRGFYYRQAQAGQLCAGRDAVIARSGGECPIATLARTRKAPKAKAKGR